MPIEVSLSAPQIKPVNLNPIKNGEARLAVTENINTLESRFLKGVETVVKKLVQDSENAVGTRLTMFLLKECATMTDSSSKTLPVLINPQKESLFKLDALVQKQHVKSSTSIGIYDIVATGEMDKRMYLFDLVKKGGKLRLSDQILSKLNGLVKTKKLKFRIPPVQKTAKKESAPQDENNWSGVTNFLQPSVVRLEAVEQTFEANPNKVVLKGWAVEIAKLKQRLQWVKKNHPMEFEEAKQVYASFNQKFITAKEQLLAQQKPQGPTNIEAKLQEMEDQKDELAQNLNINALLDLLSMCQKFRTNPKIKAIRVKNELVDSRFKQLQRGIKALLEEGTRVILNDKIKNVESTKDRFKTQVSKIWDDFIYEAEREDSFEVIAEVTVGSLLENIKTVQKNIAKESIGLLEASRFLGLGEHREISRSMTELRSAVAKLKTHMETEYKSIKKSADAMALLEQECLAATIEEEKNEKIHRIEEIAKGLTWETTWEHFSYDN